MKQIFAEKLTKEAFAPFGDYYDLLHPDGYALCGELHRFYPDRLLDRMNANIGFSPITVRKPDRMLVTAAEYHTTTAEVILPLTDDMVLHVAPPSAGKPVPDYTRAFLVPKGTIVRLNACVWHLAPLPATQDSITCLIILPECTYMNDCTVVNLDENEQFEIRL